MAKHPPGSDESLSIWIDTTPSTAYPSLHENLTVDVAIVGGGITGITAAHLLAKGGRSVALVDKGRIAMSETGHTTAHIIEATDADYRDLIKIHGIDNARLNTEAIRASIQLIRSNVEAEGISCGLKAVDGFLYTEAEEDVEYLQRQQEYLLDTGIVTEWVDKVPLPFATKGGLLYRNQFIFHIREYLRPLAKAAEANGARIFENTLVNDVTSAGDDGWCSVKSEQGTIRARHVLLATHVPINDRSGIWAKMYITRTYVVAAHIPKGQIPDALYWDTAYPYHYTRLLETNDGYFLIVGGEDRDVGKEGNDEERYETLEQYCRGRFGVTKFTHRWSGQINEPADMLPFIGESSHGKNVWMSTGYSGTGHDLRNTSAMLLSDFALGRQNPYAKLYDPGRTKIGPVLENVVTKATTFPKRMIEKVTRRDVEAKSVDEVGEGEGKIVSLDGTKSAVCRIDGELCSVDPTCPHMGCTVAWNAAEKSWDCPCHGSRFNPRGEILNGPATAPLKSRSTPPGKPFSPPQRGEGAEGG
jgi:glycine/D-amino acid oxidase-like deaminating enzyme/nitrite reductase/ring-hydroxylating ferredoxin subunit